MSTAQKPPSGRPFSWDWRGQPPMGEMAEAITELSARGQVHLIEVQDGTDQYTWVVSNQPLTEAEAAEVVEASTVRIEDL